MPMRSEHYSAETCRVYFMGGAGLIKIGVALDVDKRFREAQNASPVELSYYGSFPGTLVDERELHAAFSHLRHHGEWFQDTPELRSEIISRCGDMWLRHEASAA